MDLIDDEETRSKFGYLTHFKHLRYYGYQCKAINNLHTFPIDSTIQVLRLRADFVKFTNNMQHVKIPDIRMICGTIEMASDDLPSNELLYLECGLFTVYFDQIWYLKVKKWEKVEKSDVLLEIMNK
eukprot:NODE_1646_length_718_cov_0.323102.p1 type:complete len:126 gc:universal NODE_1646_length_718_cov_0.323102:716-339(-)